MLHSLNNITTQETQENKNKKPDPEQLYSIHEYWIQKDEEKKEDSTSNSKQNNDRALDASQIQQTASARDYYKEAALRDFTEMVDAKFRETLEKRRKWK
ncbi:MAG TPA: hypothetical protein VFS97_04315 [Nitrososphaeraceae archaeon]|nr:hypothetical protein [Nitrososphaeraceae archaeon]